MNEQLDDELESRWEEVRRTYLEVKSIRKTADVCGISKSGVMYILEALGVPRFPRNRSGRENSSYKAIPPGSNRAMVRDPVVMRRLYEDERKSIPEIAEELGLSQATVFTGLAQCGIPLRSKSEAIRGKPRPNYRGSRHRDWKGGVTEWRKRARKLLNPAWVRPIMERDNFRCKWCGETRKIVVHHIRAFSEIVKYVEDNLPSDVTEEERIDALVKEHRLEDGITLCKKCHDDYHKEFGK